MIDNQELLIIEALFYLKYAGADITWELSDEGTFASIPRGNSSGENIKLTLPRSLFYKQGKLKDTLESQAKSTETGRELVDFLEQQLDAQIASIGKQMEPQPMSTQRNTSGPQHMRMQSNTNSPQSMSTKSNTNAPQHMRPQNKMDNIESGEQLQNEKRELLKLVLYAAMKNRYSKLEAWEKKYGVEGALKRERSIWEKAIQEL